MHQEDQENCPPDRMSIGVTIAGYAMAILLIALLFVLAAPVSG
jgi:hypothetical protein